MASTEVRRHRLEKKLENRTALVAAMSQCVEDGFTGQFLGKHRCPCGGRRRPGVVWFGEPLPAEAFERAAEAAAAADIILVAGTSSLVYPAAGLPEIGRRAGAWTVEVNPERTAISDRVDERIAGASGSALPALLGAAALGAA